MNKRQKKKATKKVWHPLTMRVKLRNGKIRNRTWKLGCYLRYAKITYPPINLPVVKREIGSTDSIALHGGHWVDIEAHRNSSNSLFGYNNGMPNRNMYG